MSSNIPKKDIRTLGYVLRRTNYAEADRILNLITPQGKITAIAKSVRKEKSKLAGGVEMFTLTDFNIHLGRSEFGVITGAKMKKYYSNIIKDFTKMELAALILKKVSKLAENSDNPEFFKIVDQSLAGLDGNNDLGIVESWALLNLAKATGEEVNLHRDVNGEKLKAELRYTWDGMEGAFVINEQGDFGADEIKMLRLMLAVDLKVIQRVKVSDKTVRQVLGLARMASEV